MMRILKDAEVRKNEILDVAADLFNRDGFDKTTISAIIDKAEIARGTIYYHFKSKEDILDALIQRHNTALLNAAKQIAADKSIPVLERLFRTLMAMNSNKDGSSELIQQMHKPQNALMHQKTHQAMLELIPPILMVIIEDGIKEGLFNTPYPYESLEMVVAHINLVFDDYLGKRTNEELLKKVQAFIFNIERMFGAKPGSFNGVTELFRMEGAQS